MGNSATNTIRALAALVIAAFAGAYLIGHPTSAEAAIGDAGAHRGPYDAVAPACANSGNPKGICWWQGWELRRRSVCIETSIKGAPLPAVARDFSNGTGLRVVYRYGLGWCRKAGYASSQTVKFLPYSAADKQRKGSGSCGTTAAANYGLLRGVHVKINVTGTRRTPCGTGVWWTGVFEHELAHAVGLSHRQPHKSSVTRTGYRLTNQDRREIAWIYRNNIR